MSETHESRMPCPNCLGTAAVIIRNGPHAGVHCAIDDTWLYWAPKVELGEETEPQQIKAIETEYAGCNFRSRLEARWAVFFDALGLEWSFEPEGFELPSGRYLPDFWLPTLGAWFEVKGKTLQFPSREVSLAEELAEATNARVFIAEGDIPRNMSNWEDSCWMFALLPPGGGDDQYLFCLCRFCGQIGIEHEGKSERIVCCDQNGGHKERNYDHPRILAAYKAARSARFEFGQSGVAA